MNYFQTAAMAMMEEKEQETVYEEDESFYQVRHSQGDAIT